MKLIIKLTDNDTQRIEVIMFKEKLSLNKIKVLDRVINWEEAVRESAGLLELDDTVPPEYKEKIIESVNELGPYIFIAPEIALPHVQYFESTKVGVSLLKVNEEVVYDEEHKARLFFTFSAEDGDSHMGLIQSLATFLFEEENVSAILSMNDEEEILEYIKNNG